MKKFKYYSVLFIAFCFLSINANGQEGKDDMAPREKWSLITTQGTIKTIDKETREVTLMGTNGGLVTITADESAERFDELVVDDVIVFDYWTYMKAEFRAPTAEELAEPLVMIAEAGKAPKDADPGVIVGAVVKAVVSIEMLNRPNMLAAVKGPRGNYMTIQMEDREFITKLHIGQVFILTYAEAMVMSLDKVN